MEESENVQTTNNLGLKKPGAEDVVNIEDLNSNSDALDGKFGAFSGHGHTGAAGDGPKIGSGGLAAGAATDTVIGSRTVSDTTAPTGDSGTPTTLFGWLANMIKAITGGATWRTLPGMTIAAIKTILDAATNAGTASTLMKRDASGRAQVVAPSAAADIARKDTVDAVQSNLNTHAAVGSSAHGATSAPTVSTLMARDSAGRAQVVTPSVAADIANKGYVDSAVSGATIPDASLTVKGKAQLSSATNSTSEVLAATPKAVKDAYDRGSAGVTAAAAAQTRANAALPKDGSEAMTGKLVMANNVYISGKLENGTEKALIHRGIDGTVYVGGDTNDYLRQYGNGKYYQAHKLTAPDSSCITINGSNLDDFRETGFYMGDQLANAPEGLPNWFYIQVYRHNEIYVMQRASELTVTAGRSFERYRNGGGWGPWIKMLNNNDYNALFQYANDGKTAVANAVTAKGVSASPSETFAALASKIGQIVTGKRFAQGNATAYWNSSRTFRAVTSYNNSGSTSANFIEVGGLDFPAGIKFILVSSWYGGVGPCWTIYSTLGSFGYGNFSSGPIAVFMATSSINGAIYMLGQDQAAYVNNNGFCLPVSNVGSEWESRTHAWVAFGD
jgi:hypothetical protein